MIVYDQGRWRGGNGGDPPPIFLEILHIFQQIYTQKRSNSIHFKQFPSFCINPRFSTSSNGPDDIDKYSYIHFKFLQFLKKNMNLLTKPWKSLMDILYWRYLNPTLE